MPLSDAFALSISLASCGTRVSSDCETFDVEADEDVAEVFRHSAACHLGFQPARVRLPDGGEGPIARGASVEVSWRDEDEEEHWSPATVAACLRSGNYDLDVDFTSVDAPDEDLLKPDPCWGGMDCPFRSQVGVGICVHVSGSVQCIHAHLA